MPITGLFKKIFIKCNELTLLCKKHKLKILYKE